SSSSIHSHYQRHLTDLPWGTRAVHLQLTVRKFLCRNPTCARRMFTERLPALVAAYARKTGQLAAPLRAIALPPTQHPLAPPPTTPSTLLRLLGAAPNPQTPTLQAVGVDEWAWRRGHRYGTILVNRADHRVVDLLPDRAATSVAAWLAQHPTITVVCRDRSDLYADGIRRGAPEAVQGGDRLPPVQELRHGLGSVLLNHRPGLPAARRWDAVGLSVGGRAH